MLIDTHAHLYAKAFDKDRQAMIERAKKAGIEHFLLPNIDSSSIEGMMELEATMPNCCHSMMGLHPCSVKENYKKELNTVKQWLDKRDFIAVGEIGIDLHWDKTFFEEQKKAFVQQAEWAMDLNIPIVVHCRASMDIVIDLVKEINDTRLRGVFHCFNGEISQAQKIIDLGFYLGIGGVLTFKNSGLDKTLEKLSLEKIILETDAPYLAPVPNRGKRNESSYVTLIADKLSIIKELSLEEVAEITTKNARKLFKIPVPIQ